VVLVIISAFAGLALPAYGSAVARYRLDSAAYELSGELDRAAAHARMVGAMVTIRFNVAGDTVEFDDVPHRTTNATSYSIDLRESPRDAGIVSADFNTAEEYTVSGFGVPSSGGVVMLQNTAAARQLTIDAATGRSRVSR